MKDAAKLLCCSLALLAVSCGKQSEKPRVKTFLTVEQPVQISELTLPGLEEISILQIFV